MEMQNQPNRSISVPPASLAAQTCNKPVCANDNVDPASKRASKRAGNRAIGTTEALDVEARQAVRLGLRCTLERADLLAAASLLRSGRCAAPASVNDNVPGLWVLVQVAPHAAAQLEADCATVGLPCWVARYPRQMRVPGAKVWRVVECEALPGYAFIRVARFDAAMGLPAMRGVTGLVGVGAPARLTDKAVFAARAALEAFVARRGTKLKRQTVDLGMVKGDAVRVAGGPFDAFEGVLTAVFSGGHEATVDVAMLGRVHSLRLPLAHLAQVA